FELAAELTGSAEDGQFANASSQSVPQIAVERPGMSRELRTVQPDSAWAPQPPDRPAPRGRRGCHRSGALPHPAPRISAMAGGTRTLDRHPEDTWLPFNRSWAAASPVEPSPSVD